MLLAAHGLSPSLVFRWRRLMSEGGREAVRADDEVVPVAELRRLEERVRDLERLLGRKTMENGSSRRRSSWRGQKNRSCCPALCRRTAPDEAGYRYARPGALEHRRACQGRASATRAANP